MLSHTVRPNSNVRHMNRLSIFLMLLFAAHPLRAAQDKLEVVYDPRPDHGIPREVVLQKSRSARDYGPMKSIVNSEDILLIKVRYYDTSFKDIQEVQSYLISVLVSDKGSTNSYIPWAESLPAPYVEATIYFKSLASGKWLLWPSHSVFQDEQMKWWFGIGF